MDQSVSLKTTDKRLVSWHLTVVLVLLAVQSILAWRLMCRYSVTVNEAGHIPAGLAVCVQGDFSLYCVNPPAAKVLAAIPVLLRNDVSLTALQARSGQYGRDEFLVGYLFSESNRVNYHDLVVSARSVGLLWLYGGGLLLWRFAKELYGNIAGITAVALWVSEPRRRRGRL